MREEIERFFGSYRDAFNGTDPAAVARHFVAPSALLERQASIWATADQVLEAMSRLVAFYRDNGFETASFAIERLLRLQHSHTPSSFAPVGSTRSAGIRRP